MSSTIRQAEASSLIPVHPAEAELHVASLIVHTRPEALSTVKSWLSQQLGVEIHAESEQGKLVVVMESERAQPILDLIDTTQNQPGVINAALVYHEILAPEQEEEAQ